MAIVIHSPREIEGMRRAGRAAAATLAHVKARLRPGISTQVVDDWVRAYTRALGARPSQLGYHGFPAAVCTSRNHVVCHGIPSKCETLREGDILNVDVTSELDGFHGDTSETFFIGTPSAKARHLVEVTRACLAAGIAEVRPEARLGDVGAAIEALASLHGFAVVQAFGGHGIGRQMHMEPHVSHVGRRGLGPRLCPGMTFTIEPMLTVGSAEVCVQDDGWTVHTADGSWSAQCEHTVLVTETGCEILTAAPAARQASPSRGKSSAKLQGR